MTDQSIGKLFRSAEIKLDAVEASWDSSSSTYKENLAAAIATFEECRLLADRLSLFSPNETLEDIATGDLQYLLVNYRLGYLLGKVSDRDRKSALQKSRTAYERYLSLISHYDILSPSEKKLHEYYTDNPTAFSTISTTNAEARRSAKIANYNQEKELKRKLDFLSQNPAYLQTDDQAVRDLHLATIHLCTHHTFQALESLNRELEILALAPPPGLESLALDDRERNGHRSSTNGGSGGGSGQDDYSERLDRPIAELLSSSANTGPILDRGGKPLRPFTLLDSRQRLQAGVFKAGHNLPTMTIDEYLEEEKRRGGIIEGGGEASGIRPEPDEDDHEKADKETVKAREWDEFVEANPKGSGNRLNRG